MAKKPKDPTRHDENRHHLQCRSNGGSNKDENISILPRNQHCAYHLLFSNMLPPTISHILNDKFLDRRWKMVCVDIRHYDKVQAFVRQLT